MEKLIIRQPWYALTLLLPWRIRSTSSIELIKILPSP